MRDSRRWVFGLIGLGVILALIIRPGMPLRITDDTRTVFELIESLDSTDVVMVSFDHEASSLPEVRPLAQAVVDHCFRRHIPVVGLALFSEGTAAGYSLMVDRARQFDRRYGTDWVYLGFRPQYASAILGMGERIGDVFESDYEGNPLSALPLSNRVRNYDDVDLVISVADGSMPTYWVEYARSRYNQRVVAALTAVMVTSFLPYLESGQLDGVLAGLKAAAEYEHLLGRPGAGVRGMDAQSVAHGIIAALIILGNVQLWMRRRKTIGGPRS
ncbi:MAG: hypothetical protein Kow0074_18660 [Candidatus Zixiibacteriota bacterium]